MLSLYMIVGGFDGSRKQPQIKWVRKRLLQRFKHVEAANGGEACKDCETHCKCIKNFLVFGEIVVKKGDSEAEKPLS